MQSNANASCDRNTTATIASNSATQIDAYAFVHDSNMHEIPPVACRVGPTPNLVNYQQVNAEKFIKENIRKINFQVLGSYAGDMASLEHDIYTSHDKQHSKLFHMRQSGINWHKKSTHSAAFHKCQGTVYFPTGEAETCSERGHRQTVGARITSQPSPDGGAGCTEDKNKYKNGFYKSNIIGRCKKSRCKPICG